MKKLTITVGLYLGMMSAVFAQKADSSYHDRKLKIDEINLVSSYYQQDGNKSAVTGGLGTEWLNNLGNSIDLKLSKWTKRNRQHSLSLDFNIDYYTSASSDNIDPSTTSGASRADLHFYPSIAWNMKDEKRHFNMGASGAYSIEWDYRSYGGSVSFSKASKNENTEISFKANAFLDEWLIILPSEFRGTTTQPQGGRPPRPGQSNPTPLPTGVRIGSTLVGNGAQIQPRNTFGASLTWSQVINRNLQISLMVDPSYQEGLLSTPYHRVYLSDNTVNVEKLPTTRFKLPVSIRASYFLGDKVIIRSFYRFYQDDWGMKGHTVNLEVPYKITPFVSVSPYYRYNYQTAISYFAPYQAQRANLNYYSSDYDLSEFGSHFFGSGFRYAPPNGVMGISRFNMVELRYGRYNRGATGLVANIISLQMKIK
jgi:Protein of unknown function (DUF3570)